MDNQSTKKPLLKKWWVWALIVFFVVGLVGSIGDSGLPSSPSQTAVKTAPEPAYSVTAFEMAAEYKENEVAADAKYKDKLVEISGTVDTIGKDIVDTPYIAFATANQYEVINRIQCMFGTDDTEALSGISKGQKITLRGTVSGALGNIIVKSCEIVD